MNDKMKTIWSEADFEVMGWHDNAVHALSITPKEYDYELLLDIDYIFEWVQPVPPNNYFSYVVAPATLSFSGVWDVRADIATRKSVLEPVTILEIQRVRQESEKNSEFILWDWVISLEQGTVRFSSPGYSQYIRSKPMHCEAYPLSEAQRGPISFEKEFRDA